MAPAKRGLVGSLIGIAVLLVFGGPASLAAGVASKAAPKGVAVQVTAEMMGAGIVSSGVALP
ncbi:MAG TPA: hypothetical protein VJ396_02655, partial [Acidiferrobacterales bacterium]|nr:hypothetical protein [Acidiferrobacterales bacterium]